MGQLSHTVGRYWKDYTDKEDNAGNSIEKGLSYAGELLYGGYY